MGDVFNTLRAMSSYLGEMYKKEAAMMKEQFETFFSYYQNETAAMVDVS